MPQHCPYVGVTVAQFQGFMPSTLIRGLKLLGIDFVELNKSILPEIDRVADSLGSIITAFHLPLIAENGWDFSCLDYKNEIDSMIDTLQRYRDKLHLHHVVCHPPEPDKQSEKLRFSLEFLFENLQKLNIPVHLENVPALHPDEFLKIYWQAEQSLNTKLAGMCFDAPHYFVDGHDPVELFKTFRDITTSVHLSDCHEAEDVHLPFNCGGSLPVNEFLSTLRESGFCGFITLEIKPHSLKELDAYIDSYMTTLQHMNYKKYLKTKLRLFALRPLINRFAA
ncbi:sugar phosphate isomerase/epimerase [candidate division KSB1 bacterium]|nr:sugar phosphate isomerase/epimerase [candidate division KSB1 bacterium]RQW00873.1 MAG: sugar phosphate isomerase/epimerase [candidate division KSB1 bacterium]